ncbi:hypothetical protein EVAR_103075_1 [Eumeta japonica]|uniref:Uncharacterized protein n=1 Tax=Eumeta variegata TaxID=151549 RepID=A0A4C1WP60_EUMVA|nr:hypothetical protein EVAR_103075_1 [Eumeta japonica]
MRAAFLTSASRRRTVIDSGSRATLYASDIRECIIHRGAGERARAAGQASYRGRGSLAIRARRERLVSGRPRRAPPGHALAALLSYLNSIRQQTRSERALPAAAGGRSDADPLVSFNYHRSWSRLIDKAKFVCGIAPSRGSHYRRAVGVWRRFGTAARRNQGREGAHKERDLRVEDVISGDGLQMSGDARTRAPRAARRAPARRTRPRRIRSRGRRPAGGGGECVEQSGAAILNRNEMVNEAFASDLMRIYNLDIGRRGRCALFDIRAEGGCSPMLDAKTEEIMSKTASLAQIDGGCVVFPVAHPETELFIACPFHPLVLITARFYLYVATIVKKKAKRQGGCLHKSENCVRELEGKILKINQVGAAGGHRASEGAHVSTKKKRLHREGRRREGGERSGRSFS